MASDAWLMFHGAKEYMLDGTLDMDDAGAGVFKCALLDSGWTPSLSGDDTWGDVSANDLGTANGYTAAGLASTSVTWTNNAGTMTWDIDSPNWTAAGGDITARYACIYQVATGKLICYSLLDNSPADVTAANGTDFLITIAATGVFQLS